jgi:hypothetical protein
LDGHAGEREVTAESASLEPTVSLTDFAYVVPRQAFVYKEKGEWRLDSPVGKDAISHFLMQGGWSQDLAKATLNTKQYVVVADIVCEPNCPELFQEQGKNYINTWVKPKLIPVPVPDGTTIAQVAPRIFSILDRLTDNDPAGVNWLCNWMALKVQNPGLLLKVAVLFSTAPGLGKGTLASIMFHMLGKDNCAILSRDELESRFNSRWAQKLFVLADEVLSSENLKDVSDHLKLLIDSPTIKLEGKGRDQRSVTNRLAWMFASNDQVTPVRVDSGDRRYSVFSNHKPVDEEYKQLLIGLFDPIDRETPSDSFRKEMEYFYHYLLSLSVDRYLVSHPYMNAARQTLIDANKPAHEMFFDAAEVDGIDSMLELVKNGADFDLIKSWEDLDFGPQGVTKELLYRAYELYVQRVGARGMKYNKFCAALKNQGKWKFKRNKDSKGRYKECYICPKTRDTRETGK